MTDRPLIFSAPMVRALLDGRIWDQMPEVIHADTR